MVRILRVVLALLVILAVCAPARAESPDFQAQLRARLERALDRWCRWLAGYLYPVPQSDFYTLNPTLGTGMAYRTIAGNQFAAAAAGYWMAGARPDASAARPLEGLIKLALGTHVAVRSIDRPDVQPWGAGYSKSDDWHADLFAGTSGILLAGRLPPVQQRELEKILAWEADKQVEFGISAAHRSMPGRSPASSVGESNAWSAALLQAARAALPQSPRQPAWREAAMLYSLNAISLPEDLASDRVVGGKPLRQRVKGANFEPGAIQEHHGFYHPCYMGWTLCYEALAALLDESLPPHERNADVYLHHWREAFDRLKQATLADGRFIYCAGYDWNSYGYGNALVLPIGIFAAARFNDPDASRMVDRWLSLVEHEQDLAGGAIQGARLATLTRLRVNDYAWYEAISGASLALALWTMDRLGGCDLPRPATEAEFNAHNRGTYLEPNAKLVWHRDAHRFASFCWRSAFGQYQALVQPVELAHLLKYNHNGLGLIDAPSTIARMKYEFFNLGTLPGGGFWSLGTIGRVAKSTMGTAAFPLVHQHVALVALPEGPSLWIDQCQALDQLWLAAQGSLGVRLAADVYNGGRVRLSVDGQERSVAPHPCRDTWIDLGARELVVERRLTLRALSGEGSFQLLQKRARPADRSEMLYANDPVGVEESLLAHELYFGPPRFTRQRVVAAGEWFRDVALVIYCDPAATPRAEPVEITGKHPCFAVRLPRLKRTVALNFSAAEQKIGALRVPAQSVVVE